MPAIPTGGLRRFVIGFWVVNLVIGLGMAALWFWKNSSALTPGPSPDPSTMLRAGSGGGEVIEETLTPTSSLVLGAGAEVMVSPTITLTPSHTPTASGTPTATPTPVPFSEGPIVIGQSVQGRPLEVYRFGTGPIERLIVAGMHGGSEYNTIQLADELMAFIREYPAIIPESVTLYILRDLNPDGEALGHDSGGRLNANGVDLNRNWDANWQKTWPRTGCWPGAVSSGAGPASEPETQALAAFILAHPFNAIINYHSAALGIFPGGLPPDDNSLSLAKTIAAVTTYPYPPITNGCLVTGGFTDWADEAGIAAVDIELTNHTRTDYEMNLLVLNVFLNWKP